MLKIAIIPIDNRPICYDLIKDTLAIDDNIKLYIPEIKYLGGLTTQSNQEELLNFINNLEEVDYFIVSLDTIAYGGLVASRRTSDTFDEVKSRMEKFKILASQKTKKILAFSSIMRISNNNINEEEKEYWAQYGKRIFDWSYYHHKSERLKIYNCVHNMIPENILDDYLATRKRNFDINKMYLNWAKEGFFDTLVYSKDDCAEFGLNIQEAEQLNSIIEKEHIKCAYIKTGADEIPLSLLSRAINSKRDIKVNPVFLEKKSTNLISKYEDISINSCVLNQLSLANVDIDKNNYDLNFIINNFKEEQGDLVLGDIINSNKLPISNQEQPFFIADVNNANGADNSFINNILKQNINNLYGYCGYNTSANTIGCAIFIAIVKFLSIKNNSYNHNAFLKIIFIRLMDDWAYQSIVRKYVRNSNPNFIQALDEKRDELNLYSEKIKNFLGYYPNKMTYSLPWNRSFEIRITLD